MTEYAVSKHATLAWGLLWCRPLRASQVALVVKNLPADAGDVETWIQSLGLEDPLEESMAAHFSVLPWRIHGQRNLAGYSPWGHKESDMTEATYHTFTEHLKNSKCQNKIKTLNSFLFVKSRRCNAPVKDVLPTPEGKWHFYHWGKKWKRILHKQTLLK